MAIASLDERPRLGTRPTRIRTGREFAHMKSNDEPERILHGTHMTEEES
jgi:hypothetical protein